MSQDAIKDARDRLRADWFGGEAGDWPPAKGRVTYPSRAQVLELAVQLSRTVPGHVIEFGVWKGHSTRVLRDELWRSALGNLRPHRKRIYACDSFRGLPEGYERLAPGTFATVVPRLVGVRLVPGFFDQSLTPGLAAEVGAVSLAHFDADLYESTRTALEWLTPLLRSGSLLLFDEFCGEDPAEERAFTQWSASSGVRTALLAVFGREPSGGGERTDRRALFQVVGDQRVRTAPPLLLTRLRRKLLSRV
jgi:hypothetical protein